MGEEGREKRKERGEREERGFLGRENFFASGYTFTLRDFVLGCPQGP